MTNGPFADLPGAGIREPQPELRERGPFRTFALGRPVVPRERRLPVSKVTEAELDAETPSRERLIQQFVGEIIGRVPKKFRH